MIVDEHCGQSRNESGTHCDCWYDDKGCCWCGTSEPNLLIMETE